MDLLESIQKSRNLRSRTSLRCVQLGCRVGTLLDAGTPDRRSFVYADMHRDSSRFDVRQNERPKLWRDRVCGLEVCMRIHGDTQRILPS